MLMMIISGHFLLDMDKTIRKMKYVIFGISYSTTNIYSHQCFNLYRIKVLLCSSLILHIYLAKINK